MRNYGSRWPETLNGRYRVATNSIADVHHKRIGQLNRQAIMSLISSKTLRKLCWHQQRPSGKLSKTYTEISMIDSIKSFAAFILVFAAASAAMADPTQSFTLGKGQVIRITPEGKVEVFAKMQGNAAHVAKMEKRAKPITKGLVVWVGNDGKLRYLTNPVEDAEHGQH
jgi:hypothetical protein